MAQTTLCAAYANDGDLLDDPARRRKNVKPKLDAVKRA